MSTRRQFHLRSLAAAGALLGHPLVSLAQAGDFPNRPIRIIVPFAAGGGPDLLARKMAVRLAEVLGQGASVVVENIVGAGGILAAQNVARMAPDGYSLLMGASSHITQKAMQPSVKFDPLKDFSVVTRTAFSPSMLVVGADAPYRSLDDLVAAARANPGKFNYASGGIGSAAHLAGAAMVLQAQIDVVHVPYKGSVEIIPSILSGATQFAFPIASTAVPQVKAGKVRALAVTSGQRMPGFADVPTLAEVFRNPELAMDAWFGLWAPAGTPQPVIDALFKAVARTYEDPAARADVEAAGSVVALSKSPDEFRSFIEGESRKFEKLVKAARLGVTS